MRLTKPEDFCISHSPLPDHHFDEGGDASTSFDQWSVVRQRSRNLSRWIRGLALPYESRYITEGPRQMRMRVSLLLGKPHGGSGRNEEPGDFRERSGGKGGADGCDGATVGDDDGEAVARECVERGQGAGREVSGGFATAGAEIVRTGEHTVHRDSGFAPDRVP